MRARFAGPLTVVVVGMFAFSACSSDAPISGPQATGRSVELRKAASTSVETVGNLLMSPLRRSSPLESPVTWSFVAGPLGVTSSNAATGLTIAIPSGALSSSVTITVTALEGSDVAYAFAPHGLQFAADVQLTQSLAGTQAGALNMSLAQGGHFAGDEPEVVGSLVRVTETSPAQIDLLQNSMTFAIRHFSGWIAGSGRSGGSDSQ